MNKFKISWFNQLPWNKYVNTKCRDLIYDPTIHRVIMLGKLQITIMK